MQGKYFCGTSNYIETQQRKNKNKCVGNNLKTVWKEIIFTLSSVLAI